MTDMEGFVSTFTVAEFIDKAPKTVRNWARQGIIPGNKQGRDWLFVLSDVKAALSPAPVEPWAPSPRARTRRKTT
jgi:hypothetical protein